MIDATLNNTCQNDARGQCECSKEKTCLKCYAYERGVNPNFSTVKLDNEPDLRPICSSSQYKAYNFSNIQIAKTFQSKSLAANLVDEKDFMPRLCIKFFRKSSSHHKLRLLLNDMFRVSQSAYLGSSTYTIKLYKYELRNLASKKACTDTTSVYKLDLKLLDTIESIELNDKLEIENIQLGSYLVEVCFCFRFTCYVIVDAYFDMLY